VEATNVRISPAWPATRCASETIVDGEAGTLLLPDFLADSIADAVTALTPAKEAAMCYACTVHAELFSSARLIAGQRRVLEQ